MATIRPYCTVEDVVKYLPSINKELESDDFLLTQEDVDSFCFEVSAEIDYRLSVNGYVTPIDTGDTLIAIKLKNVAIYGTLGRIERAIKKLEDALERSYHETMFLNSINAVIKKGLPGISKKTGNTISPRTQKTTRKPLFTKYGINVNP